jgi:hypothetical protein
MSISELVRIENGELLGFRQALEDALTNAEVYAKALDVELGSVERRHSGVSTINAKNDDVFIPVFLRKK